MQQLTLTPFQQFLLNVDRAIGGGTAVSNHAATPVAKLFNINHDSAKDVVHVGVGAGAGLAAKAFGASTPVAVGVGVVVTVFLYSYKNKRERN